MIAGGASHNNFSLGNSLFWSLKGQGRVAVLAGYHSIDLDGGATETLWHYTRAGSVR